MGLRPAAFEAAVSAIPPLRENLLESTYLSVSIALCQRVALPVVSASHCFV